MKWQLAARQLSAWVIAALTVSGAAAQSGSDPGTTGVSLYGIVDVGVVGISGAGAHADLLVSSGSQLGSRVGIRGNEVIAPGWRAVFALEHQLYADSGTVSQQAPLSGYAIPQRALLGIPNTIRSQLEPQLRLALAGALENRFWHRQAWVGLVTPVGGVLLGRQYSPAFQTFGRFDPHQAGNVGNALATLSVPTGLEVRIDNSVQYVVEAGGWRFNLMGGSGENQSGAGDFWGVGLGYTIGGLDLGVAHQQRKTADGLRSLENNIVGAAYTWGPLKLTGLYLTARDRHPTLGAELRSALAASTQIPESLKPAFLAYGSQIASNLGFDGNLAYGGVHYQLNARNKVVLSYGRYSDEVSAREAAIAGIAFEHSLSRRTQVWLSFGYVDNRNGQQILPFAQGLLYGFTDQPGRNSRALSLNLVHRF